MDPADIIFALDDSNGLGRAHFENEVDFVTKFAKSFDIGPSKTQFGVISRELLPLNRSHDTQAFVNNVKQLPYMPRPSSRGNPMQISMWAAREFIFTSRYGDRPTAKNIMIVFAEGNSKPSNHTAEAIQRVHALGIVTIALGIATSIGYDHGLDVYTHVLLVNGTDYLLPVLRATVCKGTKNKYVGN